MGVKILFLDIDGVVNCAETFQRHRGFIGIDPYLALLVRRIVEATGCQVVLSSSWRHFPDGRKEVEMQVCPILDITPTMPRPPGTGIEYCERGREIQAWLDAHPEVERYAIVDDNSDMLPEQHPNFFQTSWERGITEDISQAIILHLRQNV